MTIHFFNKFGSDYQAWRKLRARCRANNLPVSPALETFEGFLKAIGPRPGPAFRLVVRSDGEGLIPENVAWITPADSLRERFKSEYAAWSAMKGRCKNPNHPQWADNGGAGVAVSAELQTFDGFMQEVGPKPSPKHWISRRDVSKGFCSGNVIWESPEVRLFKSMPDLTRNERLKLAAVAKLARVRPSSLKRMLALRLTTLDLLFTCLPGSESAAQVAKR